MRRLVLLCASFVVTLGVPAAVHAQSTLEAASSARIERAFADAVAAPSEPPDADAISPVADSITPAVPDALPAQNAEVHPPPAHTGFSALFHDTVDDFKAFPRRQSTWVILGIGAGAALLSHPEDDNVNGHLVGSKAADRVWAPGKYLGAAYTQAAVSIGLYTIGRYVVPHGADEPRTNKWSHMGFDLLRAQILSQAIVHGTKYAVRRDRPTGECCSFPSGHAATAFAAASVIERHFGYRMSLPMLAAATYVATSRLHDNRHFLSDVLFGSAIGTATGWTVVGRHGRSDYAFTPVVVPGGVALQISHAEIRN